MRDIAQTNAYAIFIAHHYLRQLRDGLYLALGVEDNALIGIFQKTRAAYPGRTLGGAQHFLQGQAITHQLLRVDLNLKLRHIAAEYHHVGHARQTEKLGPQGPFRDVVQFHWRAHIGSQSDDHCHAGR